MVLLFAAGSSAEKSQGVLEDAPELSAQLQSTQAVRLCICKCAVIVTPKF